MSESRSPAPDRAAVMAALARVMPRENLLSDPEDTRPFEADGLTAYRRTPWLVA